MRCNVVTAHHLAEQLRWCQEQWRSVLFSVQSCFILFRADGRPESNLPPIGFWDMIVSVVVASMCGQRFPHDGRTALEKVNGALNVQIYLDEIPQHHVVPLINVADGMF